MDGLPVFAHPQLFAAVVALLNLSLALGLEAVILMLSLRSGQSTPQPSMPAELLEQDFYDWLYE